MAAFVPLLLGARPVLDVPRPRDRVEHQWREVELSTVRVDRETAVELAAGDFDEDGTVDLLCAYSAGDGTGRIAIHHGLGALDTDPFAEANTRVAVPVRPRFLTVGDFDGDRHLDAVVAAHRGTTLHFYVGDGRGGLSGPLELELPGRITAMVAGEIGRPDGRIDLAVAVEGEDGSSVLWFAGGDDFAQAEPRELTVPASVGALEVGRLDDRAALDLVVATGRELRVIDGTSGKTAASRSLDEPIVAIAVADSVWEEGRRDELSVLTQRGDLITFALDGARLEPVARSLGVGSGGPLARLLRTRATGQPADELLLLDGRPGLNLIAHRELDPGIVSVTGFGGPPFDEVLRTALPMRLNGDTLDDLVAITPGGNLLTLLSAPAAVLTVDSPGDGIDLVRGDGLCATTTGECSLRAALQEANALPGADMIVFDLPADTLTIAPTGSLPVVTETVTIDATTQTGFSGSPIVTIDGSSAGSFAIGLSLTGGGIAVRGLAIGGFGADGLFVTGNGSNAIEGNYIGVDPDGTTARPNGIMGVTVSSESNTIGGTDPAAFNLISGNGVYGVWIDSSVAVGNDVVGNWIGTDAGGTGSIPNTLGGVTLTGGSLNRIGAPEAGAGNVISGNGAGVLFQSGSNGSNTVQANRIGTAADGLSSLGNTGDGVALEGSDDTVGGTAPNTVAFNAGAGVRVTGTAANGNRILRNSVFSNGGLGIDLGPAGVTPNDPADPDPGANDLQNYPELDLAQSAPGSISIDGRMDGPPSSEISIEFFSNDVCDDSGHGEGRTFLGSTTVTTDAGGLAAFSVSLTANVPDGRLLTATATNPAGSTSEFSACLTVGSCTIDLFAQTIVAPDADRLSWPAPADVAWVRGDLALVSVYDVIASGTAVAATELVIAADAPPAGSGLYYLVRNQGDCSSWQTAEGAEPDRDLALP